MSSSLPTANSGNSSNEREGTNGEVSHQPSPLRISVSSQELDYAQADATEAISPSPGTADSSHSTPREEAAGGDSTELDQAVTQDKSNMELQETFDQVNKHQAISQKQDETDGERKKQPQMASSGLGELSATTKASAPASATACGGSDLSETSIDVSGGGDSNKLGKAESQNSNQDATPPNQHLEQPSIDPRETNPGTQQYQSLVEDANDISKPASPNSRSVQGRVEQESSNENSQPNQAIQSPPTPRSKGRVRVSSTGRENLPGAFPQRFRAYGSRPVWAQSQSEQGTSNHSSELQSTSVPPEYRLPVPQHNEQTASVRPESLQRDSEAQGMTIRDASVRSNSVNVVQFPSRDNIHQVSEAFLLQATLVSDKADSNRPLEDPSCRYSRFSMRNSGHLLVSAVVYIAPKSRRRWIIASALLGAALMAVIVGATLSSRLQTGIPKEPSFEVPFKNVASNEIFAYVPETICYERNPGAGRSLQCHVNDTIMQGGGVVNLVAKALLEQVELADISIINCGSCRSDISAGNYTGKDIKSLLPFQNTLVTFLLTGQQIIEVLDQGLAYFLSGESADAPWKLDGAYPYAAGLRYDVDMTATSGEFLSNVEFQREEEWMPLKMEQEYTVLTNEYLANGGDGYFSFATIKASQPNLHSSMLLDETRAFAFFAKEHGVLKDPPLDQYSTKSYVAPPVQ